MISKKEFWGKVAEETERLDESDRALQRKLDDLRKVAESRRDRLRNEFAVRRAEFDDIAEVLRNLSDVTDGMLHSVTVTVPSKSGMTCTNEKWIRDARITFKVESRRKDPKDKSAWTLRPLPSNARAAWQLLPDDSHNFSELNRLDFDTAEGFLDYLTDFLARTAAANTRHPR